MEKEKISSIENDFAYLIEKYKNIHLEDIEKVNCILDSILLEFDTYERAPKFILTRALYRNEENGVFEKGKFVIRPNIKYALKIDAMKNSFILINNEEFFVNFIQNILNWINSYNLFVTLEYNLNSFNFEIDNILKSIDYPYDIKFTLGEGIVDICDNSIILGLDMGTILNLKNQSIFSEDAYWRNRYIENFISVLKECNRPYDIIKVKSDITYELGIYNRKSINKLLRKIVNRNINFVRVGLGYLENENSFCLIEKIPISEKDSKNLDLDEVLLIDNENPTIIEKKKGLNKIVIKYKLSPFEKKTNVLLDISLREYLKENGVIL